MTQDIQAFMLQLRSSLEKYNEAYFLRQEELVPESVREQLKAQLFALEKQYPQYATADSPTQTVGSGVDTRFQSVTHTFRKYSLEDVFSLDELQMWVARFQKASGFSGFPQLIAEYKVDGLNMTLELKQGIVVRALTRGDGFVGEDVTHTIAPLFRGQQFGSLDGFVSWEVFLSFEAFQSLKKEMPQSKNPRNLAAGLVRRLDFSPQVQALSFLAYQYQPTGQQFQSYSESISALRSAGMPVLPQFECHNWDDVTRVIAQIESQRSSLPYGIDGVVLKVESVQWAEAAGYTAKFPRSLVAYKFPAQQAVSRVRAVEWSLGRSGVVTPVVLFDPVLLDGSSVSRATLHNREECLKKDVRLDDSIIVYKAGDIIPAVQEVILDLRPADSVPLQWPQECPACGHPLFYESPHTLCKNPHCYGAYRQKMIHAVSRPALDIEGLGESAIDALIEKQCLTSLPDLFYLTYAEIRDLPLFAQKSAQNLLDALEEARFSRPIYKWLFAFGIEGVGAQMAKNIARWLAPRLQEASLLRSQHLEQKEWEMENLFGDLDEQLSSPEPTSVPSIDPVRFFEICKTFHFDDWCAVDGVGKRLSGALYDFFHGEKEQEMFHLLSERGVFFVLETLGNQPCQDWKVVVTGVFPRLSRQKLEGCWQKLGATVQSAVTQETRLVCVGDTPWSKADKAMKLQKEIWNEDQVIDFFRQNGVVSDSDLHW